MNSRTGRRIQTPDATPTPTVCEYEAEAVEQLVLSRIELSRRDQLCESADQINPTDDLLLASVARVVSASERICGALGLQVG